MGKSWDGSPPGTLADITDLSSFQFGVSAFSSGVYAVTWQGGISAWRGRTTIGADEVTLFDPGDVPVGTVRTITMTAPWTMWATTPALIRAESTGLQWAFASLGVDKWAWGLEDIAVGHCDCDFQDAYGLLQRLDDVPPPSSILSETLDPTPTSAAAAIADDAITAVPEPGTIALVGIGLAGLVARRRGWR